MVVERICDRAFCMDVEDPYLWDILEQLETTGDATLDIDDLQFPVGGVSDGTRVQLLRELVVGAFEEAGYIGSDNQRQAMLQLFDVAERAKRFSDEAAWFVKVGDAAKLRNGSTELRLNHDRYCKGYPHTSTIEGINKLSHDMSLLHKPTFASLRGVKRRSNPA